MAKIFDMMKNIIIRLKRRILGFGYPVAEQAWDFEYLSGKWDNLGKTDGLGHYSIIVGYIQHLKPMGAILDIGCGEGILQKNLIATSILGMLE